MLKNLAYIFIRSCVTQISDLEMYPQIPESFSKWRLGRLDPLEDTYIPCAFSASLETISSSRVRLRRIKLPDNRLDLMAWEMKD